MKTFFGMLLIMGTLKFPRIRTYWQGATKIPSVSEAIPVNRFFKLRSALHITEPTPPPLPTGKFWKVQPVIDAVRRRCQDLPPAERNSIDEQMIFFTGCVDAKQFVKNKPNPEGIEVFIRWSSDGVAHDFELYQGKGTSSSLEHKHLGLGGSMVMRLIKNLPKLMNFKCYFDNYFTSIGLLRELKALGIRAIGTIRAGRGRRAGKFRCRSDGGRRSHSCALAGQQCCQHSINLCRRRATFKHQTVERFIKTCGH